MDTQSILFFTARFAQLAVGTSGNALVLLVIRGLPGRRTNAHVLMGSLALADLVSFLEGEADEMFGGFAFV